MNKKLFSWKALAGLALLVAMGMTSCKNTTEVDPNDPYNVTKPVTPTAKGTTLSGFKTVAELNKLIAGTKDITDNIAADKSVTINLDCSNLEAAAGDEIVIPGKTDATIELVFTNKAKKNEGLVISDAALDNLTITFPEGEFGSVAFEMPYSKLTVASAGATTLDKVAFAVNKNRRTELTTTIKSGITINSIMTWYVDANDIFRMSGRILAEDGVKFGALAYDKALCDNWYGGSSISNGDDGYNIPNVTTTDIDNWEGISAKSIYVVDNKLTIGAYQNNKKTVVDKIIIAEGDTAYINGGYANEILGEGEGAVLTSFNNNNSAVKYSNLTIDGQDNGYGEVECSFENCNLVDFNYIILKQASAKGLKFTFDKGTNSDVRYIVDADATASVFKYNFESCEFAAGVKVSPYAKGENVLDKNGNPIKQTLYHYEWDDPDDDPDQGWITKNGIEKFTDIPEAVRKGETGWYYSYTYEPKVINFNDLSIIPSFKDCKYDDRAMSDKNYGVVSWSSLWNEDDEPCATVNGVQIGDKLYKRIYTKNNGYILVEQ